MEVLFKSVVFIQHLLRFAKYPAKKREREKTKIRLVVAKCNLNLPYLHINWTQKLWISSSEIFLLKPHVHSYCAHTFAILYEKALIHRSWWYLLNRSVCDLPCHFRSSPGRYVSVTSHRTFRKMEMGKKMSIRCQGCYENALVQSFKMSPDLIVLSFHPQTLLCADLQTWSRGWP